MSSAEYRVGDVFEKMADISDGSIDLIITSPPFLALRSYLPADHPDKGKEIGSEATPADFLTTLLALTVEWRRVLAPHGSLCVELGDTYAGSGGAGGDYGPVGLRSGQPDFDGSAARTRSNRPGQYGTDTGPPRRAMTEAWPLDKSLCLLPTLYPASLAYGHNLLTGQPCEPWRIRNQIVWHRPNPPVGALGDKVRPSTSYITVACTSRTRWFDLDAERTAHKEAPPSEATAISRRRALNRAAPGNHTEEAETGIAGNPAGAPPLDCWQDETQDDVWTLPTSPYPGAHYATFSIKLPRKLINLMCPRQVCTVCGEPRRRITSVDYTPTQATNNATPRAAIHGVNGTGSDPTFVHGRANKDVTTLGWTNCDCGELPTDNENWINGHPKYRRGIVLDPFCGSGTTLVAASELGRDSLGIDLDSRNLDLARERLGMFLVEDEVVA